MQYGEVEDYGGRICRPPMEEGAFILPVEDGCSHNQCSFCHFFKRKPFRLIPMEQVESELRRINAISASGPRKIFLGGGDAFCLETESLLKILDMIHHYCPGCRVITADATVSDVAEKSDAELKQLAEAGISCLYIGYECGLDDVLSHLHKDHTTAQAIAQSDRLHAAGIPIGAHLMTGAAGAGRGAENAPATAALINRIRPVSITNVSMAVDHRAPLDRELREGTFRLADAFELLAEERLLAEEIDVPLIYDSFLVDYELRFQAKLPKDKEKLLQLLDAAAEKLRARGLDQRIIPMCGQRRNVDKAYIVQPPRQFSQTAENGE